MNKATSKGRETVLFLLHRTCTASVRHRVKELLLQTCRYEKEQHVTLGEVQVKGRFHVNLRGLKLLFTKPHSVTTVKRNTRQHKVADLR